MHTHHTRGRAARSIFRLPLALTLGLNLGLAHAVSSAEPPSSSPTMSVASAAPAAVLSGPSAAAPSEAANPTESDSRFTLIVAGVMVLAYLIRRRSPD